MNLRYGSAEQVCIFFASRAGFGFASAWEDWDNASAEDETFLDENPECLPLMLEGFAINEESGSAADLKLGWVCGYQLALAALLRELEIIEWWELSPAAYDALCERFEVGSYEPPAA